MNFNVSIIVVTHNNAELTRQCLESIYARTRAPKFQVIVVDNASQDSTVDFLTNFAATHPTLRAVLNKQNTGFAQACNQGAQQASGEYLVFLNNDTIIAESWLTGLIRHLQDPRVGIVGPVTNSSGNESRIPVNYRDIAAMNAFARRLAHRHRGQSVEIPMLAFFCVMLRREVFEQVGPLDERFGIGMFEDDDYALRLKEKGYKILCAQDVFIHHWGGASFALMGKDYYAVFLENLKKFESKWGRPWHPQLLQPEFLPQQLRDLALQNARLEIQIADHIDTQSEFQTQAAERIRQISGLQAQALARDAQFAELQARVVAQEEKIGALHIDAVAREEQIAGLQILANAREQRLVLSQAQSAGRQVQIDELQTRISDREGKLDASRAQEEALAQMLENARKNIRILRRQLARLEDAGHRKLGQAIDNSLTSRLQLEGKLAKAEQLNAFLNKQLVDVHFSTGWSLLKVLWRFRLMVIPHESRREKWARSLLQLVRQTRQSLSGRGSNTRQVAAPPLIEPAVSQINGPPLVSTPASAGLAIVPAPPMQIGGLVQGLVSIVLPVYNQASYLSSSIASVLAQTYQDFELIVVDDGSTDDIESVLVGPSQDPRIRILRQNNQTLPSALSNGFRFARGEFWTWTSADNLMQPEQLASQVEFLQAHRDTAMGYGDYLAIDDRGAPLSDPSFRPQNRRYPDSAEIHLPTSTERLNDVQDNFIGPCFMYRGLVGQLVGDYAPELGCEDYDYWMRINRLFKIRHLETDRILYQYRVHANTLNANARTLKIQERVQSLMAYERARHSFYELDWSIRADAMTAAWLEQIKPPREYSIAHLDDAGSEGASKKILFLVHAASLPELADRPLPSHSIVASWFDEADDAPYEYRSELGTFVDICFSRDAKTLARLNLCHSHVFRADPGLSLLELAFAFGNNALAFRNKYTMAERCRELPRVYLPPDRHLRVLLQVDRFTQGGLEQAVLNLVDTLLKEKIDVSLLVLGDCGDQISQVEKMGVPVLRLPDEPSADLYRNLLLEKSIDLVNAHYSVFGAETAASLNIPFVQTIHNAYVWLSQEERQSYAASVPFTTAFVCVSHTAAFYSDVRLQLPPDKMVVIHNGIDLKQFEGCFPAAERQGLRAQFGLKPDDFVFLNVASIHPPKAQRFTIRALARVRQSYPNAKLVLVGSSLDSAYMDLLQKEIADCGLTQAVVFAGYHKNVIPFYWMADGFLLPSFWEGWSLALGEAAYAGLPIIASDVGAAREVLDESTHEILEPPYLNITELDSTNLSNFLDQEHSVFVHDLAEAMEDLCLNQGASRLKAAKQLDYQSAYASYIQLFRWLIQGGSPCSARPWAGNRK